jgi:iron complex outermembrane receptor protein
MRTYTLILIFCLFSLQTFAQITLTVRHSETDQPLDSVRIQNIQTGEQRFTNTKGQVLLTWQAPVEVMIFKPSFSSRTVMLEAEKEAYQFSLRPLSQELREIVVQGYAQNRHIQQVPGSIQRLSSQEIGRFDQTSLLPSVNVMPGVRLEERSPGSYRVAIRGSSLRSPFGVRNVKIYWNGMPLTEPGGDTQLNFLDLVNIDQLEVIKGPAGSLYGAGTGGVMMFETRLDEQEAEAGYTAGGFGLQRAHARLTVGDESNRYGLRLARQETDGYREHSALKRSVAQLGSRHLLSPGRELNINLLYTNLSYQIPGGLNPEQYAQNPQQARPGMAASNSSINYDVLISSISHTYRQGNFSNQSTLFSYLHYFDHPFITDYKKESTLAGGGRTVIQYNLHWGQVDATLSAGGEYQLQHRAALNFGNVAGQPDTLNFSDEILSTQYLAFSQADIELPHDWLITAGLSLNRLRYQLDRLYDAGLASSGRVHTNFRPDLAARIGAAKVFTPVLSLHGSISQGFSPPSLREFRTNEGSINTGLQPERGTNYELGIRGELVKKRLFYDLVFFHFRLEETIVSYQDPSGVVLFRNAGATRQNGLELWADYLLLERNRGFLRQLRFRQSYTYHHFLYQDYRQRDQDYDGNRVPGVAPHTLASSLSLLTGPGLLLQADWLYTDAIPLNDANTVMADSFHLLRARIAYRFHLGPFRSELFSGADNLLNVVYSLGNDINPEWGNRYFQPAPARSFYTGLRMRLNKEDKKNRS